MKKYILLEYKLFIFTIAIFLFPFFGYAQGADKCLSEGYSVFAINGVFTDEIDAIKNKDRLKSRLRATHNNEPLIVDYLHNPSHLAGIGDGLKALYQKVFDEETVEDYDLVEMLQSASEKVKTKKVLLVAHSQGNFYANSFHDKVYGNQENASANSIAVYSVATPASRVAGGGKWLTSSTDKVISDFVASVPFRKIMPANTNIELKEGDDKLGHNFSDVYIKYRANQIVSDIKGSLDNLKANNSENLPCIAPPKLTTAHKVEGAIFAVVDPVAETTLDGTLAVASGVYGATKNIASAIGSGIQVVTNFAFSNSNSGAAVVLATENSSTNGQTQTQIKTTNQNTPVVIAESNQTIQQTEVVSQGEAQNEGNPTESVVNTIIAKETTAPEPAVNNISEPKINFGSGFSPGFGGGSAPAVTQTQEQTQTSSVEETLNVADVSSEPEQVLISVTSPVDFSQTFATTTIIFSGTSTPGAVISNSFSQATTTSSGEGNWSFSVSLFPQGASTIQFFARVLGNENIGQQEVTLTVDIPVVSPPAITSHTFPLQLREKSVTFSGTATPGFTVTNNFNSVTTVIASSTVWSIPFSDLPEGTTTIKFFVVDQNNNISDSSDAVFNVYTVQPRATGVSVAECAYSLQSPPQSCFIPAGQATISWSVNTPNYSYFEIIKGTNLTGFSTIATTSETSVVVPTTEGPYDLKVVAVSIFGNSDLSTSGNTTYFTASHMPIIINEVAWAGNIASPYAEWIELKNRTIYSLNLSGLYISAEDGTPHIPLSGTIPPNGYFLIGRGASGDIFSDVVVDLAVPFSGLSGGAGLSNDGEVLSLIFGGGVSTSTVDQTPILSECGGWCGGGSSPDYKTMERKPSDTIGSDKNNWGQNDGSYLTGHDKDGNAINGTPKARNSISMGRVGFYCDSYTSSFLENEYYTPALSGSSYYNCRFLTDSLTGYKVAGLYRGVVGSSTSIYGLDMGTNSEYGQLFNINPTNFVSGENYFAVIYENPLINGGSVNITERIAFNNFFIGTSATPPHQRYGVLNWVYGVAP
ncbi:MAG: Phospholipase D/competence protein ComEA helix-hairpin-helix domain protein [Parcubacteria group bacterium LiPW_30]|nr:MAG: Phospholipase D/competence protein ComEA helix-hairpin-helix domain protein [Parcubacteria group bacterium LiPW_30]